MDDSSPTTTELPERKNRLSSSGIKRNKVSRACDECRKRKVRCDGAQPCARCQKSSTECIFSNVTPKRGPPKQYIEPFELRLKAIEKILDVLELSDPNKKDTRIFNEDEHTRPEESSNNSNSRLDVTLVGQALYIPDYPARLDRVEPIYSTILNSNPPQPLDLPTISIRFDLIQSYFENIHPFIPFLHRDTFEYTLHTSKPPALLLNAMYAVASYWIQNNGSNGSSSSNTTTNNADPPGWSFYKTATSLIDKCADAPRLSTVHALILLMKYHEFLHRPGFFWRTKIMLQLAIQISKDLGLSREIPKNLQATDSNSINGELQRRTFWAVYAFEILMSTEQGLEPYFKEELCTVEYPHVLADESAKDSNAVLNFYWLSKVIHVLGAVLQFVRMKYNGKEENWSIEESFAKVEKRLEELGASKPGILENDIGTSYYHLVYHSAVILLYRPYAMECVNSGGSLVQSQYLTKCLNSSCMITDIVTHLVKLRGTEGLMGLVRGVQQIIYYLTAAITVQRSMVMDHSTQLIDGTLSEKLEQSTAMLQVLIRQSPVTELETSNPPPSLTDPCYYWSDKPEFQVVSPSNTSSTRSSPLIPQLHSPHSPSVSSQKIRKRLSRSSCQFASPDVPLVMQSSSVFVPELNQHRMHSQSRSHYANNRLSAPSLGSIYPTPYAHQQVQPHVQPQSGISSYSQPSSPTTSQFGASPSNADAYSGGSGSGGANSMYPPVTPRRTTSLSRKQGLRRSASSAGEFVVPSQRPNRAPTPRPYIVNPRRHTLSNATPPDLSNMLPTALSATGGGAAAGPGFSRHLHAMAVRNNRFSAPVLTNTQLPYTIPFSTQQHQQLHHQQQQQQQQQQQFNHQHAMVLDPSFPMDPVIPDSPNESMMGLLMNPWDFSSPNPQ
ncbi:hypothetical protein K501DRAFT_254402 [Backusella circina FSU 941]|nr:hypothetical protein K501DRAFT_254402 [Backusella circina FSU 941]